MPPGSHPAHPEQHFTASAAIRDIVIGISDGLTVPFALAAGLSGAVESTHIILTAGLAEIAAGSIAMGLGGYLAAKGDADHYTAERLREEREVEKMPELEAQEVQEILESYGLESRESHLVVSALRQRPKAWIDFMMRFELGLEEPDPSRAVKSAATIGGSYIAGGMIPLAPYFFVQRSHEGFLISVAVTLTALLIFGYVKGRFTDERPVRSAFQTLLIGSVAAAAAYFIAKSIS